MPNLPAPQNPTLQVRVLGLEQTVAQLVEHVIMLEHALLLQDERIVVLESWLLGKQLDLLSEHKIVITDDE